MRPRILPEQPTIKPFWFGILSLALGLLSFFAFFSRLPPQLPLFYSRPWGEEQLVEPLFLFLPLIVAGGFLVLNLALARLIPDFPFLRKVFVIAASFASLLAAITVVRIIFLVI